MTDAKKRRCRRLAWALAVTLSLACGSGGIRPVDILAEDVCALCGMAISENRCAVEFIDKNGTAFKFDDLSCMAAMLQEKFDRADVAAYFVADYDGGGWIRAEEAFFVRSSQISTPMGGGIVAFRDRPEANAAAARFQGEVRTFAEVLP